MWQNVFKVHFKQNTNKIRPLVIQMLYRRVNVLLWVARLASQNQIPRATFNSKTGRHDTSIQRTRGHGKEIPLYMSKSVSLRIHLKQVHRHVWHRDGQNVSIGDDNVTMATHRSNQTLHNTLWKFCHSCCSAVISCGSVLGGGFLRLTCYSSASHRCSVGFKLGERTGQGNAWPFWWAETPDKHVQYVVWLKHSTIDVHMQNDVLLQDLVSMSDARQFTCDMPKSRPTTMMDSCRHHETVHTKTVDLLLQIAA